MSGERASEGILRSRTIILIGVAFCFLPFLDKAFHIDDVAFLSLSKMIGWNPLRALPADIPYMGRMISGLMPYESTHPLLVPYFIKTVTALFGENEVALHALFLVFPVVALLSFARLNSALRPEGADGLAPLFLLAAPAFLVNAQNIMTDVPTLAFLLFSAAAYCTAMEEGQTLKTYAGGLSLTAAVFVSYQSLFFIPLVFIYGLLRKRLNLHLVLSLGLPLFALVVWFVLVYESYSVIPLLKTNIASSGADIMSEIKRGLLPRTLTDKVISIFSGLGASLLFVLVYYHFRKETIKDFLVILLPAAAAAYILTALVVDYPPDQALLLSVFSALGIVALTDVVRAGVLNVTPEARPRMIFLSGWVFVVLVYNIFLLPFGAARYLLPALPPAIIILLNTAGSGPGRKGNGFFAALVLVGSISFGMAAAWSDYRYADSYRQFAREVGKFRVDGGNAFDVWYVGEWGMRYYMDREGARYLLRTSSAPRKGDFVIIPEMPRFWMPSADLRQRLGFYATREFVSAFPVRLFNRRSNAGFYAHHWGLLPFAFSREPFEVFQIWDVRE